MKKTVKVTTLVGIKVGIIKLELILTHPNDKLWLIDEFKFTKGMPFPMDEMIMGYTKLYKSIPSRNVPSDIDFVVRNNLDAPLDLSDRKERFEFKRDVYRGLITNGYGLLHPGFYAEFYLR